MEGEVPVRGKNVCILDDIISTGGTIIRAIEHLKSRGAKKIIVGTTHGVFAGEKIAEKILKNIFFFFFYFRAKVFKKSAPATSFAIKVKKKWGEGFWGVLRLTSRELQDFLSFKKSVPVKILLLISFYECS